MSHPARADGFIYIHIYIYIAFCECMYACVYACIYVCWRRLADFTASDRSDINLPLEEVCPIHISHKTSYDWRMQRYIEYHHKHYTSKLDHESGNPTILSSTGVGTTFHDFYAFAQTRLVQFKCILSLVVQGAVAKLEVFLYNNKRIYHETRLMFVLKYK